MKQLTSTQQTETTLQPSVFARFSTNEGMRTIRILKIRYCYDVKKLGDCAQLSYAPSRSAASRPRLPAAGAHRVWPWFGAQTPRRSFVMSCCHSRPETCEAVFSVFAVSHRICGGMTQSNDHSRVAILHHKVCSGENLFSIN